jgi:hypothetical protein
MKYVAILGKPSLDQRGTVTIEFAMTGILLVLIVLFTFDFGRAFYFKNRLLTSLTSIEGADLIGKSNDDIELDLKGVISSNVGIEIEALVTDQVSSGIEYKKVVITGNLELFVPTFGFFPNGIVGLEVAQLVRTSELDRCDIGNVACTPY